MFKHDSECAIGMTFLTKFICDSLEPRFLPLLSPVNCPFSHLHQYTEAFICFGTNGGSSGPFTSQFDQLEHGSEAKSAEPVLFGDPERLAWMLQLMVPRQDPAKHDSDARDDHCPDRKPLASQRRVNFRDSFHETRNLK
jgi:hypothetical protein